ncbi:hypothetical protein [Kluyvera intermedia]|uniref:tellurite resistance TerB family protein n=1 Tax=Kluyvera intermedia TaxID=61648 RepID=UPI0039F45D36
MVKGKKVKKIEKLEHDLVNERYTREQEVAHYASELDKRKKKEAEQIAKFNEILSKAKGNEKYFYFLIACVAVGISVANSDGDVSEKELEDIELCISCIDSSALPKWVQKEMLDLLGNPVHIKKAFEYAVNSGVDINLFDVVIEAVINSDGYVHENEKAFVQAWHELKVDAYECL